MKYLLSGIEMPLDCFDGVEVSPIEESDGFCTVINPLEFGINPDNLYYWAVYLHYDPTRPLNYGGVEWVADLPTEYAANSLASGLLKALEEIRSKAL